MSEPTGLVSYAEVIRDCAVILSIGIAVRVAVRPVVEVIIASNRAATSGGDPIQQLFLKAAHAMAAEPKKDDTKDSTP